MSSQRDFKRRCLVKKLDFENSIVTNIKTNSRIRKKFRARITHEFKNVDSEEEKEELGKSTIRTQTSPMLNVKKTKRNKSQLYSNKRKLNFPENEESPGGSLDNNLPGPASPVFKIKTSKISSQASRHNSTIEKVLSQASSNYQIEEFSEDSKQSADISSVDSEKVKTKTPEIDPKNGWTPHAFVKSLNSKDTGGPEENDWTELLNKINGTSAPIRRRYKKNSLQDRLQKLLKRKASDKLLQEHENRKETSLKSQKFSVVSFWNEESKFFYLKCQSLESIPETSFIVVDSRWAPQVRKTQVGSLVRLHPPWQKISIQTPAATVFMNVVCLEVVDDNIEPISKEVGFESISHKQFDVEPLTFLDTLLASNISTYFY